MSITDDFYLHFPSLNENSKENIRNRRITEDCLNFLTKNQFSPISPKKSLDFKQRRSQLSDNVITNRQSESLKSPMDEILSADVRNRWEIDRKLEQKKIYLQVLEKQIEEQQLKKAKERERRRKEEEIFEQRYNRQIQQQIQELRQQREEKLFIERVSLSENEKEKYNHQRVPHAPFGLIAVAVNPSSVDNNNPSHRSDPSSNNKVYRYFSKSAKKDSELFNYKKLFEDIVSDYRHDFHYYGQPELLPIKKSSSEGKLCLHPQAECTRCRKKLNVICNECDLTQDENKIVGSRSKVMKTSNNIVRSQSQNEYNEHDLPISKNQQVVIYRPSDQHMPYSFNNVEKESHFDHDMLEDLKKYSDRKLANYKKNYGSLRKKKILSKDMETGMLTSKSKENIPKDKVSSLNKYSTEATTTAKEIMNRRATENAVSDLDDLFNRAQITTITQVGLARKHLAKEVKEKINRATETS